MSGRRPLAIASIAERQTRREADRGQAVQQHERPRLAHRPPARAACPIQPGLCPVFPRPGGIFKLYYDGAHGLSVGWFHPQALIPIKDRAVAAV
jgi:hypothetical protein